MIEMTASDRLSLAARIGIGEQYLYQCLTGRRKLPAEHAAAIERETCSVLRVEQLRPDLAWCRVPDASWPHVDGRPCLDVVAAK